MNEKQCNSCREWGVINTNPKISDFSKDMYSKDGFCSQCKKCRKKYRQSPKGQKAIKVFRANRKTEINKFACLDIYKRCSNPNCANPNTNNVGELHISEFYADIYGKHGRRAECKYCTKKNVFEQSISPIGKARIEAYENTQHRQDLKREVDRRRDKDPKRKKQKARANVRRKARKRANDGFFTTDQWYRLCKFYDFHCLMCKKRFPFDELTVDHIKPVSKNGSSFIRNLQPLCKSCNSRKGDKTLDLRQTIPDWIKRDDPVYQQLKLL